MFTNINSNKDELLQLILVGQPELRDTIRGPNLKQFAQRVSANFHLSEMDAEAVHGYIAHRLHKAGAARMIFTREACVLIHWATKGIPRLVNQLCDFSLVYASSDKRKTVNEGTVRNVLNDGIFFPPYPLDLDKKTNET
jgi:type II secretory pathway predicted ATPase ExeA